MLVTILSATESNLGLIPRRTLGLIIEPTVSTINLMNTFSAILHVSNSFGNTALDFTNFKSASNPPGYSGMGCPSKMINSDSVCFIVSR